MDEDLVRRIMREEITKAFRTMETEAEPVPYETGDFERIVLGVLRDVADKTADEIGTPTCKQCVRELPAHEGWCTDGV